MKHEPASRNASDAVTEDAPGALWLPRGGAEVDVALPAAVFFEIALVVFFRPVELAGRRDLGDNRFRKAAARLQPLFRRLRCGVLGRRVIKNRRAVLRAVVRTLAV